ncbi:hypothetical protein [Pedobacter sp. NJ-S-72]
MLIFITGGVRSGKSGYAQKRAKELCAVLIRFMWLQPKYGMKIFRSG